jgi:PPOX class probable F420-dependent enzyme
MPLPIPASHADLFQRPVHGVLTTLLPGGVPQASLVWVDYDGECVLINTTLERQKGRNLRRDPRATLLVIDPHVTSRWIEVRGTVVALTTAGAEAHADQLTQRYHPAKRHFYGDIYPPAQRERETRVIARLAPLKISLDAIFR